MKRETFEKAKDIAQDIEDAEQNLDHWEDAKGLYQTSMSFKTDRGYSTNAEFSSDTFDVIKHHNIAFWKKTIADLTKQLDKL